MGFSVRVLLGITGSGFRILILGLRMKGFEWGVYQFTTSKQGAERAGAHPRRLAFFGILAGR